MFNDATYVLDGDVSMQPSTPTQQETFAQSLSAPMANSQAAHWGSNDSNHEPNPFLDPFPTTGSSSNSVPLTSSLATPLPPTHSSSVFPARRFSQQSNFDTFPSFTASLSSNSPTRRANNAKRHIVSHRQATAIIHSPRSHRHVSPVSLKSKKSSIYHTSRSPTGVSPVRHQKKKRTSSLNHKALSLGTLCKMPLLFVRKGIKGTVGVARSVGTGTIGVAEGVGRAFRLPQRRIADGDGEGQEILMESQEDDDEMYSPMPLSPLTQFDLSGFDNSAPDAAPTPTGHGFMTAFPTQAEVTSLPPHSGDSEMADHEPHASVADLPASPTRTYRSTISSPSASISSSLQHARSRSKVMRILGTEAYSAALETQQSSRRRTKSLWA